MLYKWTIKYLLSLVEICLCIIETKLEALYSPVSGVRVRMSHAETRGFFKGSADVGCGEGLKLLILTSGVNSDTLGFIRPW